MASKKPIRVWWWSERHPTSFWKKDGNPEADENFGDLVGPLLVTALTGRPAKFTTVNHPLRPKIHLVVGSILALARPNCVVWGPGIVERGQNVGPADYRAVRGPLTRSRLLGLGYDCPPVYGDPAILLPQIVKSERTRDYEFGIVPHYVDYEDIAQKYSSEPAINLIDVRKPVARVVSEICRCDVILSSSLHGLIVANAYGIPAVWIEYSDRLYGDGVKFHDYFGSIGVEKEGPIQFRKEDDLGALVRYIKQNDSAVLPRVDMNDLRTTLLDARPF